MRLAAIVALAAALAASVAAAAAGGPPGWSAPAILPTCAPAAQPRVVFPSSWPQTRSGRGAILWLGGAPRCGNPSAPAGTTLDVASLHGDDTASVPRRSTPSCS